mgnify:CR=1 FL=1
MADHFRQRTYTNSEGHIVSDRYTFYKPSSYKTITLEKDLTLDEISFIYYGTPLNYWANIGLLLPNHISLHLEK